MSVALKVPDVHFSALEFTVNILEATSNMVLVIYLFFIPAH